jgi:hypothetical protein
MIRTVKHVSRNPAPLPESEILNNDERAGCGYGCLLIAIGLALGFLIAQCSNG